MINQAQQLCFDYFKSNNIERREDLRDCFRDNPLTGLNLQIVEGFFSIYRKKVKEKLQRGGKEVGEVKRVVALNDMHIPYHDMKSISKVFDFIADYKPDTLVLCGDIVDFYTLSHFNQNPGRRHLIQDEIDIFTNMFSTFNAEVSGCEKIFIQGNHEYRLINSLWANPGLFGARCLDITTLLNLNDLGFEYQAYNKIIRGFEFTHGKYVRNFSSYTAKAEYDFRGSSGMSGHTHRLGAYYKTTRQGSDGWFENACLCNLNPEYIKGVPNWIQGFSTVTFFDDQFLVNQIPIIKGSFIFGDKLYC
jgi:predicted phosphodiesterase